MELRTRKKMKHHRCNSRTNGPLTLSLAISWDTYDNDYFVLLRKISSYHNIGEQRERELLRHEEKIQLLMITK